MPRHPISRIDRAEAILRLRARGMTTAQICARLKIGPKCVYHARAVAAIPREIPPTRCPVCGYTTIYRPCQICRAEAAAAESRRLGIVTSDPRA